MERRTKKRRSRWAALLALSGGFLLGGTCNTVLKVLETISSALYIADPLA